MSFLHALPLDSTSSTLYPSILCPSTLYPPDSLTPRLHTLSTFYSLPYSLRYSLPYSLPDPDP